MDKTSLIRIPRRVRVELGNGGHSVHLFSGSEQLSNFEQGLERVGEQLPIGRRDLPMALGIALEIPALRPASTFRGLAAHDLGAAGQGFNRQEFATGT